MARRAEVRALEVIEPGPFATVQDLGRRGLAALGVGHGGAADPASLRLANRLLGNPESAAGIEVTLGGLEVRGRGGFFVALGGAPCPMALDGRQVTAYSPVWLPDGAVLRVGVPAWGLRSYLAVRGGLDVPAVLGSRSTDTLAGLGPPPLAPGQRLPVGAPPAAPPVVDQAPVRAPVGGELTLRVVLGPRADWFTAEARAALLDGTYEVTPESNRVGMRLTGPSLERAVAGELASEGVVCGAVQVPPSGQPVLFLVDHPVTGGYPVIAVVVAADVGRAAQAKPGQQLRFRL